MKPVETVLETPSRREFLAAAGAGLFIFFPLPVEAQQEPGRLPTRGNYSGDVNAYLKVGADGRVSGFAGKVELGQGAMTALAQLLADELDISYDSVDMTMADTDLCPYDMGTFGSMNMPTFGPVLRRAAAEARAVLVALAAERLQVPAARLRVQNGVVTDSEAPSKRVTYAQLLEGKRIERRLPDTPVKSPAAFAIIGKPPARRKDAVAKVSGKAKYSGDIAFPGMLHARLLRPPARGVKIESIDSSAAEKIPGVRVVKLDDTVAVLHERRDIAGDALKLVKARFSQPVPGPDDRTIYDHLLKTAPRAQTVHQSGDLAAGEKAAAQVVEETYFNAYVAHSPIETHSATVRIEGDKVTVWASTQAPFGVKPVVAQALGAPADNVRVIAGFVGGGFGGKTGAPQAVEAARLAKLTGKPVQVIWDRAEEFFFDPYRPAAVVKIRAGLDSQGKIAFWDFAGTGAGDREARQFYNVPNQRTTSAGGWMGGNPPAMHPFDVGPWRAPSVNTNTFARESHIDMLAAKAGVDPLQFRLNHLTDERMVRTLKAAAEKFGWKPAAAPSNRGVGIACGMYSGTYAAMCAEVSVDKAKGSIHVKRAVLAMDQGLTVNPDGARQQMEGSITMGLGYALSEGLRFKDGAPLDRNFDSYEIPRFSWLPAIETVLIPNANAPASAGGEPPIICMGAVLANAVYDAVGARLCELPMTPARVLAALKK
jgi:nicotinate dehydrogenase subunit B